MTLLSAIAAAFYIAAIIMSWCTISLVPSRGLYPYMAGLWFLLLDAITNASVVGMIGSAFMLVSIISYWKEQKDVLRCYRPHAAYVEQMYEAAKSLGLEVSR